MTTETNNRKGNGAQSQTFFQVLLVLICVAVFGMFAYDYLKKNKEIAEYKKQEAERAKAAEDKARDLEVKLAKVKELAELYKKTLRENFKARRAAEDAMKSKHKDFSEEVGKNSKTVELKAFSDVGNDVERLNIARKVSADLAPIISKVNKSQDLTNEKLDKAIADLITLLDKETAKSQKITKDLTKAIAKERRNSEMLRKKLILTNEIVTELSSFATELGTLYVNAHEDDSVLGNIGTAAMAPVKVVQNTLSLNLCFGRDKARAEKMFRKRLKLIMARYRRIQLAGNPRHRRPAPGKAVKEPKLKTNKK